MWQTDGQTDRRTDRQTDRRTENTICRAAWSQLKTWPDNGLSPVSYQAIIWTNAGLSLIGHWGTNFNEISIDTWRYSLKIKANLRDLLAATGLVFLLKIGFKSLIFWPMWPGNLMEDLTRQIWGIWKLRPAYSPEMPNLGQNRWCFVPFDFEIWWITLENNRASRLCCFKLCATFHSHLWIQTGFTVRKRPIWVKFDDF